MSSKCIEPNVSSPKTSCLKIWTLQNTPITSNASLKLQHCHIWTNVEQRIIFSNLSRRLLESSFSLGNLHTTRGFLRFCFPNSCHITHPSPLSSNTSSFHSQKMSHPDFSRKPVTNVFSSILKRYSSHSSKSECEGGPTTNRHPNPCITSIRASIAFCNVKVFPSTQSIS